MSRDTLLDLVDLARCTASSGNLQPLKYALSATPQDNARIFPHLGWAAYLPDWDGPAPGERPAAYIVVLGDDAVARRIDCDHGIAAQTLLLGATEKGLAGCILGNVKRDKLHAALGLAPNLRVLLVLALGRPAEEAVLDDLAPGGDLRYFRDARGVHHVPKRGLSEIVITGPTAGTG